MGKNNKKKNRKKNGRWLPPEGASAYFSSASDYEFKMKHPIGYPFLVALGMIALLLPFVIYSIVLLPLDIDSYWLIVGLAACFIIGIGLFNFVAIIIKQYLGHLVSLLSFIIGGLLLLISLIQMGIV